MFQTNEQTDEIAMLIQQLINSNRDSFQFIEKHILENNFNLILRQFVQQFQIKDHQNKNLHQQISEFQKQLLKKENYINNLNERMILFEEEYENLKILMSNKEQQNQNYVREISLSSSSIVQELNCQLTRQKQAVKQYKELKIQYNKLYKQFLRFQTENTKIQQYNKQLSQKICNLETKNRILQKIKEQNQFLQNMVLKNEEKIAQVLTQNTRMKQKVLELEYIIVNHPRSGSQIISGTYLKNGSHERFKEENLDKLKEIEEAFQFNQQFNFQHCSKSVSDITEQWDKISIQQHQTLINRNIFSTQRVNQQKKGKRQVRHRIISQTNIKKDIPSTLIDINSHSSQLKKQHEFCNRSITNQIDTSFDNNYQKWTNLQNNRSSASNKNRNDKQMLYLLEENAKLKQIIQTLEEENKDKAYRITDLEGQLEIIEDRHQSNLEEIQKERQIVIDSLKNKITQLKVLKSKENMQQMSKNQIINSQLRKKLKNAQNLCLKYQNTLQNIAKQFKINNKIFLKNNKNKKEIQFKIGMQKGCQTQLIFKHQQKMSQGANLSKVLNIIEYKFEQQKYDNVEKGINTQSSDLYSSSSKGVKNNIFLVTPVFSHKLCLKKQSQYLTEETNNIFKAIEEPVVQIFELYNKQFYQEQIKFPNVSKKINKFNKKNKQIMNSQTQNKNNFENKTLISDFLINIQKHFDFSQNLRKIKQNCQFPQKTQTNNLNSTSSHSFLTELSSILCFQNEKNKYAILEVSQNIYNFEKQKNQRIFDRFLLWKEGLVSKQLQTGIFMQKRKKKLIDDERCVLGNCEILVQKGKELLVRRRGKKNYFIGSFPDGNWIIQNVLEIGFF